MRSRAIASSSDGAGARAHRGERALLRRAAERVGAAEVVRERARGERPGAVGAVPADLGAGVDDHRLPRPDPPLAGMVVRQRRVRPGGDDDGEGERLRALVAERLLQPPGDLRLGAADELLPREPLVGGVGDRGRPPDRVELGSRP